MLSGKFSVLFYFKFCGKFWILETTHVLNIFIGNNLCGINEKLQGAQIIFDRKFSLHRLHLKFDFKNLETKNSFMVVEQEEKVFHYKKSTI